MNEVKDASEGASGSSSSQQQDEIPLNAQPEQVIVALNRSVKVPPFWSKNPQLWFHQLDAQFAICKITAERVKFNYVVASLDMDVLSQVSDIITAPPADAYAAIKQRLLVSFGETEERRIKHLLKELELGDKRPSHLLQEMRHIAGNLVAEEFLKSLWIRQLPPSIQAVITASGEPLTILAVLADRVIDVATNKFESYAVSSTPKADSSVSSQVAELQRQIAALTTQFQQKQGRARSDGGESRGRRGRSQSRGRSASRSRSSDNGMCWYHRRFAQKATRCTRPCNFNPEN